MGKYSGSEWVQELLDALHNGNPGKYPKVTMSNFGSKVANLLGEWEYGIYHINQASILSADWTSAQYIEMSLYCAGLATFDFDNLTRLVFLAHIYAIRVELVPSTHHYIKLHFALRTHKDDETPRHLWEYHPTLHQAVDKFLQLREINRCDEKP